MKRLGTILFLCATLSACNVGPNPYKSCPMVEEDGVEKPSCSIQPERTFSKPGDYDQSMFRTAALIGVRGRDFMRSTLNAEESWISDEPELVFDGVFSLWGEHVSYTFDLVVLDDNQRMIPFKFKEVPNEHAYYEAADMLTPALSHRLNFEEYEYKNYSIAIDVDELTPSPGVHDLTFLLLYHFETTPHFDPGQVSLSSTHRVYVNTARASNERLALREADVIHSATDENTFQFWAQRQHRPLLYSCGHTLWEQGAQKINETNLYQPSQDSLCLAHSEIRSPPAGGYTYLVFEGTRLIDSFRHVPPSYGAGEYDGRSFDVAEHIVVPKIDAKQMYRIVALVSFGSENVRDYQSNIVVTE